MGPLSPAGGPKPSLAEIARIAIIIPRYGVIGSGIAAPSARGSEAA